MILNYHPFYEEYYTHDTYYDDTSVDPYFKRFRRFTNLCWYNGSNTYWRFCDYDGIYYKGTSLTNNNMTCYNDVYTYTIEGYRSCSQINDIEIFVHTIRDNLTPGENYAPLPLSYYVDGKEYSPKVSISNINANPVSFSVTIDPTGCISGEGFIVHIGVCIFNNDYFDYFASAKAKTGKQ